MSPSRRGENRRRGRPVGAGREVLGSMPGCSVWNTARAVGSVLGTTPSVGSASIEAGEGRGKVQEVYALGGAGVNDFFPILGSARPPTAAGRRPTARPSPGGAAKRGARRGGPSRGRSTRRTG